MADPSFDVVSKVDRQEVDNALNQASKELAQRFDFRGVNASIEWSGELGVTIKADTEERAKAALEVFKEKLVKRSISMKALDAGDPKPSGKGYAIAGTLRQGIDKDHARQIVKLVKDEGPKGVQVAIQDDQVRVTGQEEGRAAGGPVAAAQRRSGRPAAVHELPLSRPRRYVSRFVAHNPGFRCGSHPLDTVIGETACSSAHRGVGASITS